MHYDREVGYSERGAGQCMHYDRKLERGAGQCIHYDRELEREVGQCMHYDQIGSL